MRTWISIVGLSFVLAAGANAQIKYAGIYFGDLSGDYYSDSGAIAVMVRSNKQASLVGSAYGTNNQIGIFAQFKVQDDGTWSFNTNGTSGTGQVFTDGTITANFNFSDGGVSTLDNGTLQDDLGPYQNQAGLYAGSWSGGGQSGKVFAVLSALGEIDLCSFDPGNQPMDGGGPGGPLDTSNSFDFLTVNQAELAGTLTRSTLTIAGTWTSTGANGVFHLARTAFLAPNLPPTITSAPNDKTIPYGANAAFSVTATGAAPLHYQWYSNDVPLVGATSRTLIVSNVQLAFDGTIYTVVVSNFVDTASAEAILNAVPETVPPTVTILSPASGQRVSSAFFHVTGHAADNNALDSVYYTLNSGADTLANGTSDWSADVVLTPGTNVIAAHALDTSGNWSPTRRVSFFYVVPGNLTLVTNGLGGIAHGFTGSALEIGRTYAVTAVPGAGQVFSNWLANGSIVSSSATYLFLMQSNLVLQANFVPNPFPVAQGYFTGLFGQAGRNHARSGFFSLTLGDHGAYTGALKRGTNSYPFSGKFNVAGGDSRTLTVGGTTWTLTMTLNLATGLKLSGTVGTASWTADVLANRSVFSGTTNPAARLKGRYTLVFPGSDNASISPGGDGYATIVVGLGGTATVAGFLADNQSFSQIVPLSGAGELPFYAPLYAGTGSAWGWLKFDAIDPASTLDGDVSWIRPAMPGVKYYPAGFTNAVATGGSRYTQPAAHNPVISLTDGVVFFDGGNLSGPFTNQVTLTTENTVINSSANNLKLHINVTNGTFSGSVVVPNVARTNTFKGALLQDNNAGYGNFLGTDQSGRVFFGNP